MTGLRIFCVAIEPLSGATYRGPCKRRCKAWITGDGLLEEVECPVHLGSTRPWKIRQGAQIDIIRGEIIRRSFARSADLRSLQCRFDDTGDARRHFVLKLENVFERAVEPVGPKMRARYRVDQLPCDADHLTCLAHGPFKHVPDTKFPTDPLHIDRLALVGESRITGDDEQPS